MELDWAGNVKPGVLSWLTVGVMALTFIVLMKFVAARFPIPGFADVVNAA